jgi:hypothetical protein
MDVKYGTNKPLGQKSYGSIPHLPGSRLGPGDYHIHEGQAKIATEKARDKNDKIIVQEKLDGSNVGVAKLNGEIFAITRAGYLANTSKYPQHHYFSTWVKLNEIRFQEVLAEGERICGEWLAQAHGTKYDLPHEPFVAFDIIKGKERIILEQLIDRVHLFDFVLPNILGYGPMTVETALDRLGYGPSLSYNRHGALDPKEGAIWRVERHGKVDFLAKFIHHNKEDGKYLPEKNGTGEPIWNIRVNEFMPHL